MHHSAMMYKNASSGGASSRPNAGSTSTLNYHRIRNKLEGRTLANTAPKSAPLPRKVYHRRQQQQQAGGEHKEWRGRLTATNSTRDLSQMPAEVKNSNCSIYYNSTNNQGDYSELRAIVRRIEASHRAKMVHAGSYNNFNAAQWSGGSAAEADDDWDYDSSRCNTLQSQPRSSSSGHSQGQRVLMSRSKSPRMKKLLYNDCMVAGTPTVTRSKSHNGNIHHLAPTSGGSGGASKGNHDIASNSNNNNIVHKLRHSVGELHSQQQEQYYQQHQRQYLRQQQLQIAQQPPRVEGLDTSHTLLPHSPVPPTMENRKSRRNSASKSSSSLTLKRSDEASVTLQGWLFKQGSDGLMLWKKRWFVLTEFCLFYYKGPDEEKILGSIVLPSYKISPVSKEDGVFRKFAFKAEHQNMRTYFFAAESKESMIQWMNVMSLASILQQDASVPTRADPLQSPNETTSSSTSSLQKPIFPTSTPQFQQQGLLNNMRSPPVQHQHPTAVHQMYSPNGNAYQYYTSSSGTGGQTPNRSQAQPPPPPGPGQPLYANAPPKPKRLNASGDRGGGSSREPSPDTSRLNMNQQGLDEEELVQFQQQQMLSRSQMYPHPQQQYQPQQATRVQNLQQYQQQQRQQQLQTQRMPTPTKPYPQQHSNFMSPANLSQTPVYRHRLPQERRTPEDYGRSYLNQQSSNMPPSSQMHMTPSQQQQPQLDYEDVYTQRHLQQRSRYSQHIQSQQHLSPAAAQQNFNSPPVGGLNPPPPGHRTPQHMQRNYPPPPVPTSHSTPIHQQTPPANWMQPSPRWPHLNGPQQQMSQALTPVQQQQQQMQVQNPGANNAHRPKYHPARTPTNSHGGQQYTPQKARIPRPHSADFLEYDNAAQSRLEGQTVSHGTNTPHAGHARRPYRDHSQPRHRQQPPRPKSSVDPRLLDEFWQQQQQEIQQQLPARPHSRASTASRAQRYLEEEQHFQQLVQQHQEQRHATASQARRLPVNQNGHALQQGTDSSQVDSSEEVSRYFPTPSPRKPLPAAVANHSTMYQNIQLPQHRGRLETVTPNRLGERHLDDSQTGGEFKRSASARLHRNKKHYPESLNQSEFIEESKKKEQREESMKRLLEWKQRMLQSPLTRKSSRNASRTQTPTNSSSPVPSLGNDSHFRQKVLEELEQQEVKSSTDGNRRLSRKGSGASRSSRSRSSPRIAQRAHTSSSDEDPVGSQRQSRKRSKSQTSHRSRNSSNASSTRAGPSRERAEHRMDEEQPEYINISSLDTPQSELQVRDSAASAGSAAAAASEWKKKAIGPDDWYNDDFNYDRAEHSFSQDPILNHHYGHLLDMRYQQNQITFPVSVMEPSPQMCYDVASQIGPSSAASPTSTAQQQTSSARSRPKRSLKDQGRAVTWHADKFNEILGGVKQKAGPTDDKMPWSPSKAFEEIRKLKEAPPKNVVQDRLKALQDHELHKDNERSQEQLQLRRSSAPTPTKKASVASATFSLEDIDAALDEVASLDVDEDDDVFIKADEGSASTTSEAKELIQRHRKIREKFFESVLSDSKDSSSDGEQKEARANLEKERKRSVKELLSDFEKKSKELQDESHEEPTTQRRVFSDTETMNYDDNSSSDEGTLGGEDELVNPDTCQPKLAAVPMLSSESYVAIDMANQSNLQFATVPAEEQYLPMLSKGGNQENAYLHMALPNSEINAAHASSTSLASSTVQVSAVNVSSSDTNLHFRTPSQSLVIDHLQRELGIRGPGVSGESVAALKHPVTLPGAMIIHQPEESPRYCEIEDPPMPAPVNNPAAAMNDKSREDTAHYEYLYKARSATPLHYESVYQEIPEEEKQGLAAEHQRKLRSIEGLPDIIGGAPTHKGHSSSDADDEDGSNHNAQNSSMQMQVSDSFKPASFFLNQSREKLTERKGSQSSLLSGRELPQTPTERRKSFEEASIRSSITSLDSASRRKLPLENIQEVPQERREPAGSLNFGSGAQNPNINIRYRSVYDEEGEALEQLIFHPTSRPTARAQPTRPMSALPGPLNSSSKVPYYVSDIGRASKASGGDASLIVEYESDSAATAGASLMRRSGTGEERMSRNHSHTPDIFLKATPPNRDELSGVMRTRSLEGLLGDAPGNARDSVQVHMMTPTPTSHDQELFPAGLLPARGREPPPPPDGVPPLDLSRQDKSQALHHQFDAEDDERWRESLRRASAKHKARSHESPSKEQLLVQPPPAPIAADDGSGPRHSQRLAPQPPSRLNQSFDQLGEPHISGYIWDEREQRFYRLNTDPTAPPNQRALDPAFLDEGLLNRTDSDLARLDAALGRPSKPKRPNPELYSQKSQIDEDCDISEVIRTRHQQRRRTLSSGRKDSEALRSKNRTKLLDITAQDLLGKSHEELVLMLIHLRRQGASLTEAIEGTRKELEDLHLSQQSHIETEAEEARNAVVDLETHLRELEEQKTRAQPIISLVDNMVKLGSLYRGPQDAPLSHRIRNVLPANATQSTIASAQAQAKADAASAKATSQARTEQEEQEARERRADIQLRLMELYQIDRILSEERLNVKYILDEKELLERSMAKVQRNIQEHESSSSSPASSSPETTKEEMEAFRKQREMLENELMRVRGQLEMSHRKLDENSAEHSRWEHDLLFLRQQLQQSASRDMQYGIGRSAETLAIEGELAHVQQRAAELHRERQNLISTVQGLVSAEAKLHGEIVVRAPPAEVPGADAAISRKKMSAGWAETELDGIRTKIQQGQDSSGYANNDSAAIIKEYENIAATNVYDNNMQTVQSEGVKNEMMTRAAKTSEKQEELTFDDISEADDRVKKFYGILPKEKPAEIKTVRMVKRDSKERMLNKGGAEDDDEEEEDLPPPPPLPRGNYQNLHDFLQEPKNAANDSMEPKRRGQELYSSNSLPRNQGDSSSGDSGLFMPSPKVSTTNLVNNTNGLPKASFKLGADYYRKKSASQERPSSSLSAHERLFGSSRENSMSPPMSPGKPLIPAAGVSSDSAGPSPMMSPIFKSATAKAIIEEVGKTGGKLKRKTKRSHTISGGREAVTEALNEHAAKTRSRDDLDMQQVLRPRPNAPDVVKSALDKKDAKINSSTIDTIFGAPEKIDIPERYIPDTDMDKITPEERQVRLKKADSIRRMLADTQAQPTAGDTVASVQERSEREKLLALNQVIARQVMEKSRMVAVRALANRTFEADETRDSGDDDDDSEDASEDESPPQSLPLYQQRESILS